MDGAWWSRTESDPLGFVAAIKETVQTIDKDQPIASTKPMTAYLAQSIAQRRFNMLLLAVFAGTRPAPRRRSEFTGSFRTRSRNASAKSAFAWRSGRGRVTCFALIVRQGMRPAAILDSAAGIFARRRPDPIHAQFALRKSARGIRSSSLALPWSWPS